MRKTKEAKGKPAFEIDAGKLAEEARFDGIFVLRTNTQDHALQAVLRYRDLLQVEDLFRRTKAIMRTRPIFHSSDAAIRGHVFCTFLALVMQKYLDDLAAEAGTSPEWRPLLRDLDRLQRARIQLHGKDWLVRTDAPPRSAALFLQARIALPPRACQASPPPTAPVSLKSAAAAQGVVPRRHLNFDDFSFGSETCIKAVFKSGLTVFRSRPPEASPWDATCGSSGRMMSLVRPLGGVKHRTSSASVSAQRVDAEGPDVVNLEPSSQRHLRSADPWLGGLAAGGLLR